MTQKSFIRYVKEWMLKIPDKQLQNALDRWSPQGGVWLLLLDEKLKRIEREQ